MIKPKFRKVKLLVQGLKARDECRKRGSNACLTCSLNFHRKS